mmetsp:Transcript_48123/g.148539  ORF Transcript_48123/g.148539 Transcript_48123/m.148539 type:complete len:132 (-) Transcript_48123:170-565(-)
MRYAAFVAAGLVAWQARAEGAEETGMGKVSAEMFKLMDTDKSGWLSRREVKAMGKMMASDEGGAKRFGGDTDPGGVMFDKMDADRDGKVSKAELDTMFLNVGADIRAKAEKAPKGKQRKRGKGRRKGKAEL